MKSTEQSGRDAGQTTSDWFIRTGASQVPSPPSRLALRPPPRSGFVQWAFYVTYDPKQSPDGAGRLDRSRLSRRCPEGRVLHGPLLQQVGIGLLRNARY